MDRFETRSTQEEETKDRNPEIVHSEANFESRETNLENPEDIFVKSQGNLVKNAAENMQSIDAISESVLGQNESLKKHVEALPESEKAGFEERIHTLQEKISRVSGSVKEATAMYAKLVILGGMTVLDPNYNAVSGSEQQTQSIEQTDKKQESFEEMVARAKQELVENGITSEQKEGHTFLSNSLYRNIYPWNYGFEREEGKKRIPWLKMKEYVENVSSSTLRVGLKRVTNEGVLQDQYFKMIDDALSSKRASVSAFPKNELRTLGFSAREDAWRLYLGLPQVSKTFDISSYQPSKHIETKYYFSINGFWDNLAKQKSYDNVKNLIEYIVTMPRLSMDVKTRKIFPITGYTGSSVPEFLEPTQVMGEYSIDMGHDERGVYVSYYDKWDLGDTIEGESGLVGKPFEIYDRIYYDPKTFEPISDNVQSNKNESLKNINK